MPHISVCKMDLPSLQTIPYLHGNGFMLALVCMDSVLAHGHCGWLVLPAHSEHGCFVSCLKTMNY